MHLCCVGCPGGEILDGLPELDHVVGIVSFGQKNVGRLETWSLYAVEQLLDWVTDMISSKGQPKSKVCSCAPLHFLSAIIIVRCSFFLMQTFHFHLINHKDVLKLQEAQVHPHTIWVRCTHSALVDWIHEGISDSVCCIDTLNVPCITQSGDLLSSDITQFFANGLPLMFALALKL